MGIALPTLDRPFRITADPAFSREEFWRISESRPDLRFERKPTGEIVVMTPTKRGTGSKSSEINWQLRSWTHQDGRGDCFDSSTGFDLPDGSVLSPDASWVAWERLRAADAADPGVPLCPDFVIELRSESDRLPVLREKMQTWIANGCELAWLVDPSRKVVEIYRPGTQAEIQESHSAAYGEGPVGGFMLELRRIWS